MLTRPEALGDTTAWIALWRGRPASVASVRRLLRRGTLAVCDPVALELARGARNARELSALRARLALLPACAVAPAFLCASDLLIPDVHALCLVGGLTHPVTEFAVQAS